MQNNLLFGLNPRLLSILLVGFLSGNLFGTVLSFLRGFAIWDGFIIVALLTSIEITSYVTYKPRQSKVYTSRQPYKHRTEPCKKVRTTVQGSALYGNIKAINFFKIGVMIGFFVDAFKVGS